MKNGNTGSGLFLVVLAAAGILYTKMQGFRSTVGLSPGFFPTFVFAVIGICGALIAFHGMRSDDRSWPKFKFGRLGAIIGMLAVYIIAMDYVGFIISTLVFLLASMWFFGETRPKIMIPVAAATTAIVYLLWTYVFNITLPTLFL